MKNVILLAMSRLPIDRDNKALFSVEPSTFLYNDSVEIKDCRGQLEPIVKMMIEECKDEKELTIIMLCTDDARNEKKFVVCNSDGYRSKKELSSVEYFEERMLPYVEERGIKLIIQEVEINEKEPLKGIYETVSKLRDMYETEKGKIKLWVDTHGGFRDVSLISNAIISLLRLENDDYVPEKVFGVIYGKTKEIVEQREAFNIFRFVSGMEEFSNYGNADVLIEYLEGDENCKEVVEAMKIVANGIQECDSAKYVDGLEKLAQNINKLGESNKMIKIFKEFIESDYGDLLKKEEISPIDVIERCVNKKLYQQALTTIESMMPEYLIRKGVIKYDEKDVVHIENARREKNKMYLSNENFVFDGFVFKQHYYKNGKSIYNAYKATCPVVQKQKDDYLCEYCINEQGEKLDDAFFASVSYNLPLYKGNDGVMINIPLNTQLEDCVKKAKAGKLIRLHKALKACRNKINHSNPDRPAIENIVKTMKEYVKLARDITM